MSTLTPTMTVKPARFRGASSSDDFNQTNRAVYQDIVTLFGALAAQSAQTALQNETLATENLSLATQLSALQQQVSALQSSFQSLTQLDAPGGTSVANIGACLYDCPVSFGGSSSYPQLSAAQRAAYAPLYGQILPNIATAPISKCFIVDVLTNSVVTPPNVASTAPALVTPTVAPFLVEENDPGQAVDGDSTTRWRRNVYFPNSQPISEVKTTFTATLPQQFINSASCNYVSIDPYPVFGVDIVSVVLHGPSADIELLDAPIAGSGPVRLLFPDTQVVSVDVTLRSSAPVYTLKPGLQAFVFGASSIDVGWIGFNQSPAKVLVPFTLANNFFAQVTGLSTLPQGVSAQLYYQTPAGDLVTLNLGDSPLGYARTVYVELTLTPSQGVLPVVDELSLSYVPMYVFN